MKIKILSCLMYSVSCGVATAQTSIVSNQPNEYWDIALPEKSQLNPNIYIHENASKTEHASEIHSQDLLNTAQTWQDTLNTVQSSGYKDFAVLKKQHQNPEIHMEITASDIKNMPEMHSPTLPNAPQLLQHTLDTIQPSEHWDIALPEKSQEMPLIPTKDDASNTENVREIRSQDLLNEPELLQHALDSAVLTRDMNAVRLLLPLYLQLTEKDEILAQYAQARLAQSDGQLNKAIGLYENILENQNHIAPVRFDLMQTLLQDARYLDAEEQVEILNQDSNLPQEIHQVLQQHKKFFQEQKKWKFSGSLNYLSENNINNAPNQTVVETTTGAWNFPPPEKARGISYDFTADKKIPLKQNWSLLMGSQVYGKHYQNKSKYNDLNIGVHLGISHRNAKREWRILPIYEKRWFGGKAYSQQYGMRVRHNRPLSQKWYSFTNVRAAYNKHNQRNFLDGSSFLISQTFQYQVNPSNILLFGADFLRENARDKSSANSRRATRLGWINYWKGLETSVNVTASTRRYDAPDWFLNERRKDRQLSSYVTFAHNKIQWNGLMPKLAWVASRQQSNHLLYRYNKQQFFVELGKAF
ncbi:surface lipoprotein assembly modifier [Wielerella bovis]|uniref:surface lipoprotein assembly modifier n=1 Tax=Wielerella bovis TaxID=2917790 RepID=UPI002019365C|nr:surface lipoprotein assembly modifier [Wielerella bovis]ULJ65679.1 surface lipoprotein assembly modifier [Wielerella bovis]ULJ66278.1 surface lipoprotein assembly modifier [Wielerella bovis]